MDTRTEEQLSRWTQAALIDTATADRIRQYELSQRKPSGARWQVTLALAFGAILLAAGVALFVAAHWDALSPLSRFSIVISLVVGFHLAADLVRSKFNGLAVALHGVGTLAAGAVVFLVGQIFNIQEYWPAGILLWLLCALAGWWLLRDQVQETVSLLLLPAWILCEWTARAQSYRWGDVYLGRMLAVIGALYLTAFLSSKKRLVAGFCIAVGAIAMVIAVSLLMDVGSFGREGSLPMKFRIAAWLLVIAVTLVAAIVHRVSLLPVVATLAWSMILPIAQRSVTEGTGKFAYTHQEPSLLVYLLTAVLAAFFAWYGVNQRSRALINLGSVAFAATVLWFCLSSVMDKLGRSFSLIGLGILFLAGGWLLERLRRRLVGSIGETPKEAV